MGEYLYGQILMEQSVGAVSVRPALFTGAWICVQHLLLQLKVMAVLQ